MRIRTTGWLMAATVLVVLVAPALRAQECDDGDPCTVNDSCGTDGTCHGTFKVGAECNDFNDCTTNDRCQTVPLLGNVCQGDPAPIDTACGGGCGKCTQEVPGFLFCKGDAADNGKKPCTPPALNHKYCLDQSTCVINVGVASCPPKPKTCPTFSGCKGSCNIDTGQCDSTISTCNSGCETCNNDTCEAINTGGACDTFNVCEPHGHCGISEFSPHSYCMGSASTGSSPTPTATSTGPTPTPTVTSTATVGSPTPTPTTGVPPTLGPCVGDCNGSHSVTVNEIIECVNIALGTALLNTCPQCSTNGGTVQITDLISAVGSALNGCV